MTEPQHPLRRQEDRTAAAHLPRLRRVAIGALAAWAFIATVGVGALSVQQVQDTAALSKAKAAVANANRAAETANAAVAAVGAQQARQQAQLVEGCVRLNVQRATANWSYASDYTVFSFVVRRFLAPTRTETRAQKRITRAFALALRDAVRAKEWTPLTDCAQAVAASGISYQVPAPIPFVKRRPPGSALSPANAALTTPVGSVP
jgi:hypothetical protein